MFKSIYDSIEQAKLQDAQKKYEESKGADEQKKSFDNLVDKS
jgi:hypothetical protein